MDFCFKGTPVVHHNCHAPVNSGLAVAARSHPPDNHYSPSVAASDSRRRMRRRTQKMGMKKGSILGKIGENLPVENSA